MRRGKNDCNTVTMLIKNGSSSPARDQSMSRDARWEKKDSGSSDVCPSKLLLQVEVDAFFGFSRANQRTVPGRAEGRQAHALYFASQLSQAKEGRKAACKTRYLKQDSRGCSESHASLLHTH